MIRIGTIRPNKGFQYFTPAVAFQSIDRLLNNYDKLRDVIPESECFNVYYPLGHHDPDNATRSTETWQHQDVIAFDIDELTGDPLEFIKPVCDALEIDMKKTAVVNSGNGLHFLIRVATISDVSFFADNKAGYKKFCARINKAIKDAGLNGKADVSIFEPARVLRLPGTKNVKQKKGGWVTKQCTVIQNSFEVQELNWPEVKTKGVERDTITPSGAIDSQTIERECSFIANAITNCETTDEPTWYAGLSITSRFNDDNNCSRRITGSSVSPAIFNSKVDHALNSSGPRTCDSIATMHPGCSECKWRGRITSPIQIKSDSFIATKETGFTLNFIDKSGRMKQVRQYEDLRLFYDQKHFHKTIGSVKKVYAWNGTHYVETNEAQIKAFAETHFEPQPKENERAEFRSKVMASNYTDASFLDLVEENKINFTNGVLDLSSGDLLPHDAKRTFFNCLPYDYDSAAVCPNWENFILQMTCNRHDLVDILHEYMGFIVSGAEYKYQKALILYGSGKNGKTTFINVLRKLVGYGNSSSVQISSINKSVFAASGLHGKLVNFSEEESVQCFRDTSAFKNLTGDGTISAEFKHTNAFDMRNRAKLVISYNELPWINDTTPGMRRRLLTMPCDLDLDKAGIQVDPNIVQRLISELPGVFNHALEGWRRLERKRGFTRSQWVEAEVENLARTDPYYSFIKDRVNRVENSESRVSSNKMWDVFLNHWSEEVGDNSVTKPNKRKLNEALRKAGFAKKTMKIEGASSKGFEFCRLCDESEF